MHIDVTTTIQSKSEMKMKKRFESDPFDIKVENASQRKEKMTNLGACPSLPSPVSHPSVRVSEEGVAGWCGAAICIMPQSMSAATS